MRISCLVNLVCRHKSSNATGLACWNTDGLFNCSSSSISVASSMIGLSGGVAIARWPPNHSPLLLLVLVHAIVTRTNWTMVTPRVPVIITTHHCPWRPPPPNYFITRYDNLQQVTCVKKKWSFYTPVSFVSILDKNYNCLKFQTLAKIFKFLSDRMYLIILLH